MTPRQAAFAGAASALVNDESAVMVNPAMMSTLRLMVVAGNAEALPDGSVRGAAMTAWRFRRFSVGFGITGWRGDSAAAPGAALPWAGVAVGSLAYRRGMLSVGGSLKALRDDNGIPGAHRTQGLAADAGLAIAFFDIASFTFVWQNMGQPLDTGLAERSLPHQTRFGMSLAFLEPQGKQRLNATTDLISPPGGDSYWAIGLEAGLVSEGWGVIGRVGFVTGGGPVDQEPSAFGGALVLKAVRLDYSYQGYAGGRKAGHRVGLRVVL